MRANKAKKYISEVVIQSILDYTKNLMKIKANFIAYIDNLKVGIQSNSFLKKAMSAERIMNLRDIQ